VFQSDPTVGFVYCLVPFEFDRADETWSIPPDHFLDLGLGADQVGLEAVHPVRLFVTVHVIRRGFDALGMVRVVVVATRVNSNDVPQLADLLDYALPGIAAESVADVSLDKKDSDNVPGF
jgi:hypothetical protein